MQRRGPIHMQIGKAGITQGAIQELQKQLEVLGRVNVKFLQSFTQEHDRKQAADRLAEQVGADVADLTGGVVILTKQS